MDPELRAMSAVVEALSPLQPDEIVRVITWTAERFGVQVSRGGKRISSSTETQGTEGQTSSAIDTFGDFHELFDAANPTSGPEKALLAAYWFQVVQGNDDLDSQQLNSELKNLGHPSTNITRDLDGLINRTPRLVIQVRKEGTSRQARKKYKVTREGIKAVERMLRKPDQSDIG